MPIRSFLHSVRARPWPIWSAVLGIALTSSAIAGPDPEPAPPFLWMIDLDPPSFLLGTIHLPDERVLDLPPVVREAFDASEVVYTEITLDTATQQSSVSVRTVAIVSR